MVVTGSNWHFWCLRSDCQKTILSLSKTLKIRACSGRTISKFQACSGFLEVKNRPWSVAHTCIPDIRKFLPSPPPPAGVSFPRSWSSFIRKIFSCHINFDRNWFFQLEMLFRYLLTIVLWIFALPLIDSVLQQFFFYNNWHQDTIISSWHTLMTASNVWCLCWFWVFLVTWVSVVTVKIPKIRFWD